MRISILAVTPTEAVLVCDSMRDDGDDGEQRKRARAAIEGEGLAAQGCDGVRECRTWATRHPTPLPRGGLGIVVAFTADTSIPCQRVLKPKPCASVRLSRGPVGYPTDLACEHGK